MFRVGQNVDVNGKGHVIGTLRSPRSNGRMSRVVVWKLAPPGSKDHFMSYVVGALWDGGIYRS
jgi:hypothetical protein